MIDKVFLVTLAMTSEVNFQNLFTMIDKVFLVTLAMLSFSLVSDCMKVIRGIKIKEILRNEQVKKELLIVLKGYNFWYVTLAVSYASFQAIKFLFLWDLRH